MGRITETWGGSLGHGEDHWDIGEALGAVRVPMAGVRYGFRSLFTFCLFLTN